MKAKSYLFVFSTVLLATLLLLLCSCTSNTKYTSGLRFPQQIEFDGIEKDQYYIIGDTTGYACAEYVGLWPIPIWWESSANQRAFMTGIYFGDTARSVAYYRALEKIPQADALLAPRIEQKDESAGIWYNKRCVTIRAKAIRLIANDPLYKGETGQTREE